MPPPARRPAIGPSWSRAVERRHFDHQPDAFDRRAHGGSHRAPARRTGELTMLIGFVSDERYVALADVALEFVNATGESWEVRSRASGSVHGDLPAGEYIVTLQKPGYGSKRVRLSLPLAGPHHFRL